MMDNEAQTKDQLAHTLGISRSSLCNYIGRCKIPHVSQLPGCPIRLYDPAVVRAAIEKRKEATLTSKRGNAAKMRAYHKLQREMAGYSFTVRVVKYRELGYTAGKIARALHTTVAIVWPIIEKAA